jgi:hypothetical protein
MADDIDSLYGDMADTANRYEDQLGRPIEIALAHNARGTGPDYGGPTDYEIILAVDGKSYGTFPSLDAVRTALDALDVQPLPVAIAA